MSDRTARHTAACQAIEQYLAYRGAWNFRVRGGIGQRRGLPDIIACVRQFVIASDGEGAWVGRLVAIEVKTGAAVSSLAQKEQRAGLEHAGALYILAHDVDDVEEALLKAGLFDEPALMPRKE